jgi:alcohol dehydrogenase (NADP+)
MQITGMKYFTLHSRAIMPGIGLGTWNSDPGVVGGVVKAAIEIGYRHIDCAHIYGNEKEIGETLSDIFRGGKIERKDLFITSKLWNTEHNPSDVEPALRNTLADLGLDYIDLYLIHWPVLLGKDSNSGNFLPLDEIPIAETWKALERCVDAGLVKDIGVSNCSVKKIKSLLQTARIPPSVNQVERHPYHQNPELLDFCQNQGIHVTAYSPLGSKERPTAEAYHEKPVLDDPIILSIATKHGVTPAQILLQWALSCGTSAIPKSVQLKRLQENLDAVKGSTLDSEDLQKIASIDKHRRYVDGTFWCPEGSPYTLENLWDEEHLGVVSSASTSKDSSEL